MVVCTFIRGFNNFLLTSVCDIWELSSQLFAKVSLLSAYILSWFGIDVGILGSGTINIILGLLILYKIVGYFKWSLKVAMILGIAYVLMNIIGVSTLTGNPSYLIILIAVAGIVYLNVFKK